MSFVSTYSHIIDKTETKGIDAINPPKRLSFFAISETRIIIPEDIKTATLIQALRYFKRKDTPFNTYGDVNTGVSELFSKIDPDVQTLLKAHKKTTLSGTIL